MDCLKVAMLIGGLLATVDALRCYQCKGIAHPDNCTDVTQCPAPDMLCHTRQYWVHSEYKYDLDCLFRDVCRTIESATENSFNKPNGDVWTSCCHGQNCNNNFNSNGHIEPDADPDKVYSCYNCTGVDDPINCFKTTKCKTGEVCYTTERLNDQGQEVFDLTCLPKRVCMLVGHHLPFGKRRTLCKGCCDAYDLCNNQFCSNILGSVDLVALGPSLHPVATTLQAPTITLQVPTTTLQAPTTTLQAPTTTLQTQAPRQTSIAPTDRELTCHHCTGIDDPYHCHLTKKCKKGEVCFTIERFTDTGGDLFDLDCLSRQICLMTGHYLSFGKRRTMCKACCDLHDNCNNQFCSKTLGITNMTVIGASVHPVTTTSQASATTTTARPTTHFVYSNYKLTVSPKSIVGVLDTDTSFQCKLDPDFPELGLVTITWYVAGRQAPVYSREVDKPEMTLAVHNLTTSDAGVYTCEVNTTDYSWKSSAHLVIENGIPLITEVPHSQLVYLTHKVVLHCKVSGVPAPSVHWTFTSPSGSRLLPEGTTINVDDSVVIPSMTTDHVGNWTCLASNSHGNVQASAILGLK